MRRLITCFILALVSCIAFAKPQTKYSIKIIGEDFKPIPNVVIVSEVEGIGTVTDLEGCAVLLSGSYEDFNALKFIVSKKGYLSTTPTAEPDKTEITLVLKMDPNKPLSKKAKKNKKK